MKVCTQCETLVITVLFQSAPSPMEKYSNCTKFYSTIYDLVRIAPDYADKFWQNNSAYGYFVSSSEVSILS